MPDTIPTPDGWVYGVRFGDGSVASRWSGGTQRARALEHLTWLRTNYPRDAASERWAWVLVRRRPGTSDWQPAPE